MPVNTLSFPASGNQPQMPQQNNPYQMPNYLQNMMGYYQQINQANADAAQKQQEAQQAAVMQDAQVLQDGVNARRMSGLESGLMGINQFGESITNPFGWDPDKSLLDVGNDVRFLASIPFQMVGGLASAPTYAYEALTGNPLLDADTEQGLIGTEQLDSLQRAASAGNAFINTVGLTAGASGRILGTLGEAASAGKFGSRMAQGWVNTAGGKAAGQIAFDTLEEGAEEFVQSYLDDTRNKTLDEGSFERALQGAKWGAFGGAAASSGMYGIRKALGLEEKSADASTPEARPNQGGGQVSRTDYENLRNSGGTIEYQTNAQKALKDLELELTKHPGAYTAKHRVGNNSFDLDQSNLAVDDLVASVEKGGTGVHEIAEAFGATDDEILGATFADRNTGKFNGFNTRLDAWKALLQQAKTKKGGVTVAVGRNPDSKNGLFLVDVNDIIAGTGIELHSGAYPLVGSDVDGDTSAIYFNLSKVNPLGYASEILRNPTNGRPNFDSWYFGIDHKMSDDHIKKIRDDILASGYDGDPQGLFDKIKNIVQLGNDSKAQTQALSDLIDEVYAAAKEAEPDENQSKAAARRTVNSLIRGLSSDTTVVAQRVVNNVGRQMMAIDTDHMSPEDRKRLEEDVANMLQTRGSTTATTAIDVYDVLGLLTYYIGGKGNPIYRQYGQIYYQALEQKGIQVDQIAQDFLEKDGVFSALMRAQLRMTQSGVSPTTAIEGMARDLAVLRTKAKLGMGPNGNFFASTKENVDSMLDVFVDTYNEIVEMMGKAKETLTTENWGIPYGVSIPLPLQKSERGAVARAFTKAFGDTDCTEIFDKSYLPARFVDPAPMSLRDMLTELAAVGGSENVAFAMMPDGAAKSFVETLLSDFGRERKVVSGKIKDAIGNVKLSGLLKRWKNNGKTLDTGDQIALAKYFDGLGLFFDPVLAIKAGLYGTEVLNTRLGEMLVSDNTNVRIRALAGISIEAQFGELIDLLNNKEWLEEKPDRQAVIFEQLVEMQQISPVHNLISKELLACYDEGTGQFHSLAFDMLIDTSKSWEELEAHFEKAQAAYGTMVIPADFDLFVSCLTTKSSDFDLSGMSENLRKANTSFKSVDEALAEAARNEVAEIEGMLIDDGQRASFVEALKERSQTVIVKMNEEILGHMAYAARIASHDAVEKGTNIFAATVGFKAMAFATGSDLTSYMTSITGEIKDAYSVEEFTTNPHLFLRVLTDPDFTVRVYDSVTGESRWVSRDDLIRDANEGWQGGEPGAFEYLAVLKKYPQMVRWLGELTTTATETKNGGNVNLAEGESFKSFVMKRQQMNTDPNNLDRNMNPLDIQHRFDHEFKAFQNRLLNTTWYKKYLVAIVAAKTPVDTLTTPGAWMRAMADANEEASRALFARYNSDDDSALGMDIRSGELAALTSKTMAAVSNAMDVFTVSEQGPSYGATISDEVRRQLLDEQRIQADAMLYRMLVVNSDEFSGLLEEVGLDAQSIGNQTAREMNLNVESGYITQELQQALEMLSAALSIPGIFQRALEGNASLDSGFYDPDIEDLTDKIWKRIWAPGQKPIKTRFKTRDALKAEIRRLYEIKSSGSIADPQGRMGILQSMIAEKSMDNPHMPVYAVDLSKDEITASVKRIAKAVGIILTEEQVAYRDLGTRSGMEGDTLKSVIDGLYDKNGNLDESKYKDFAREWEDNFISGTLRHVNEILGSSLNINMVHETGFLSDSINEFLSDLAQETGPGAEKIPQFEQQVERARQRGDKYGIGSFSKTLPQIDVSSEKTQAIMSNIALMDQSGYVADGVGRNGSVQKQIAGYGMLLKTVKSDPSFSGTYAELSARTGEDAIGDNWRVSINAPAEETTDLRTWRAVREMISDGTLQGNEQIFVYDPDDNAHGISSFNSMAPMSSSVDEWHMLPRILYKIVTFSMEDMVMKAKKKMITSSTIASHNRVGDGRVTFSIDPSKMSSNDTIQTLMRQELLNQRKAYQEVLVKLFQEEMEDLGYGEAQARLIAQGMSPGIMVTVVKDGQTSQIMCDASNVLNAAKFEEWIQGLNANGFTLLGNDMEVVWVTPQEASARVMRSLGEAFPPGEAVDPIRARTLATDKLNDWSDYSVGTLSIESIFGRIGSVGNAFTGGMVAEGLRTPVQVFTDYIWGGKSGAFIKDGSSIDFKPTGEEVLATSDRGRQYIDNMNPEKNGVFAGIIKYLGAIPGFRNGDKIAITRIFVDTSDKTYALRGGINTQLYTEGERYVEGCKALAFVLDPAQAEKAIEWANKTNGYLLVRKDAQSAFAGHESKGSFTIRPEDNGRGLVGDYVVIAPKENEFRKSMLIKQHSSERQWVDPKKIQGYMVDLANLYKTADASILAVKEMLEFVIPRTNTRKRSLNELFGGAKSPHGVRKITFTQEQAQKMLDTLLDDNAEEWKKFHFGDGQDAHLSVAAQHEHVLEFLRAVVAQGGATDGLRRNGLVQANNVCALLQDVDTGTIVPFYLGTARSETISEIELRISGNDVRLYTTGVTTFGDGTGFAKRALTGETFKGIVTMMEDAEAPKVSGTETKLGVINPDTEASRVNGLTPRLRAAAYYWYTLKVGGSCLFRYENGEWRIGDWAKGKDRVRVKQFLNGEESGLRWAIAHCTFGDAAQDKAVKSLLRNAIRGNMYHYPIDILSPTQPANWDLTPEQLEGQAPIIMSDARPKVSFEYLFNRMDEVDINGIYSMMQTKEGFICPEYDSADPEAETIFDIYGNMYVNLQAKDGTAMRVPLPVRWGPHPIIDDISTEITPSGEASYAYQHIYNRGVENGFLDDEIKKMIGFSELQMADPRWVMQRSMMDRIDRAVARGEESRLTSPVKTESRLDRILEIIRKTPWLTWSTIKHREAVNSRASEIMKERQIVRNGEPVNLSDDLEWKDALGRWKSFFGEDCPWNFAMIHSQAARAVGWTYEGGKGSQTVEISKFIRAMDDIIKRLDQGEAPIKNEAVTGSADSRYALPKLSDDEIDWYWRSEKVRSRFGGKKSEFKKLCDAAADDALKSVKKMDETLHTVSQKRALLNAFEFDYQQRGQVAETGWIAGNTYVNDIANSDDTIIQAYAHAYKVANGEFDKGLISELCERDRKVVQDIRTKVELSDRFETFDLASTQGGTAVILKTKDGKTVEGLLNNATEMSKIMALLNPGVVASNLLDRVLHQGISNLALRFCHETHVGPYASKQWLNQDVVKKAVNDRLFVELWCLYRVAGFNGQELEFLANASSIEQMRAFVDAKKESMTPFQKGIARIYDIASGGNKFIKGQMENFINRFVMFAEAEGQDFWFENTPEGVPYLEARLGEDGGGARWFLEILGANNEATPSFSIAMKAMNWAKQGDMAQRNVISAMYSDIARNSPLAKFFVTTTMSRFPQYSLNVMGRMLNWVLPMSSINYVFTDVMANRAHKKAADNENYIDPHYELTQIHTSLREAMLVDITHFGITAVSAILLSLAGGVEPPEDEDKWGNPQEWTILGMRVGEAWWLEDILGMVVPEVCFAKSAMLGKPRFDLLINGIGAVCGNNPIIKVSDAIGYLTDPEGNFFTDFEEDREKYKDAKGGPPSLTDYMQANATSFGLSWASQFILPSFLREVYVSSQDFEHSYRKIYEQTPTGVLTEAGALGATQNTTYADAMLRRVTRKNPVLGLMCNIIMQPTTGYLAGDMPYTIYYDDAQLKSMEQWSIKGLSDKEQQAKIAQIICTMQSYSDMSELAKTGFFLDTETKIALSSTIWDIVHELDNWYYGQQAEGMLDYYVLGNGDWSLGQQKAAQIKQDWQTQKSFWSDFYYTKVKSKELSEGLVTYQRYNTTYAKDAKGEYYATGFRPQGVLPFISAPGRVGDPEGTAGRENDWVTISAVTGKPMEGMRALVPVSSGQQDWPDLEYWAGDGNGNGYSKLYQSWYGNAGTNQNPATGTKPTYYRYPSSGGGGYSSGGGGGGGGRIYPGTKTINAPSASVGTRTNRQRANLDYLRPAFETKGSREAYKRGDI